MIRFKDLQIGEVLADRDWEAVGYLILDVGNSGIWAMGRITGKLVYLHKDWAPERYAGGTMCWFDNRHFPDKKHALDRP